MKDDNSFASWCNGIQVVSGSEKEKSLIVVKVKFESRENASSKTNDIDEKKESPDRRREYSFDNGLSNPKNWTKDQNDYAKQCHSSFQMLSKHSLQFLGDYWQGYMVRTSTRVQLPRFV